MPRVDISSADDPRLDAYLRLTDVRLRTRTEPERGLFMAESYEVIMRALDAGITPLSFLMSEKWLEKFAPLTDRFPDVPVYVGPEALLEEITGFHLHRGALAAMRRPELPDPAGLVRAARAGVVVEDFADHTDVARSGPSGQAPRRRGGPRRSRIAIFEDLVDHTNLGAAFRSAAAFGVDGVLVTPRCADPLYRRAIRVSMGTVFQVPWTRIDPWPGGIDLLKEHGYTVAGMTLGEGAITLDELAAEDHPKLALVFGSEGHGLTPAADRRFDARVEIPMMHGVDSLNVAASAAVAFYATR